MKIEDRREIELQQQAEYKKKARRRRKKKKKENLSSFGTLQGMMLARAYYRGPGGAMRQRENVICR